MKKTLILLILFSYSYSYGYEQIYYQEEEYSPRYIIKDYSYIEGYNELWQDLSNRINLTYYDDFIHKDFGSVTSRKDRDAVIDFIKNYKIQNIYLDDYSNLMAFPAINSLILQNKALLKARFVLDNVSGHDKTSLVYLAAGLSYIYSDGLYELDKLRKIFKEWLRLGGDDFPEIKKEEKEKRHKFFSYIANLPENPESAKEFINIVNDKFYYNLVFKNGLFDIFNTDFYTVISSREVYQGYNIVKYFASYIKAEYMDIITGKHFRLDNKGTDINHYFTVWSYKDGLKLKDDNFYIFPFDKQTFILSVHNENNKKILKFNYYNPEYIDTPEYAEITIDNNGEPVSYNNMWQYPLVRNKVINSLVSSPSFSCSDNITPQQSVICESFSLRMYDKISSRKYFLVYSSIRKKSKKIKQLESIKQNFKERLDACYIDRKCLQNEYKSYIESLIKFK